MTLPPWRPLLRGARQREGRSPRPAGCSWPPSAPTAPRGFAPWCFAAGLGPALNSTSSPIAAAAKALSSRPQPRVELCWLLPKARSQFRLRGQRLAMTAQAMRKPASSTGNSSIQEPDPSGAGPNPAHPLRPRCRLSSRVGRWQPDAGRFELVRIAIEQVELLELTGHPHQRRRWRADQAWAEERLNP